IHITTPGALLLTSRGVVPHLSPDHTAGRNKAQSIDIPFESFIENLPPIPVSYAHAAHAQPGKYNATTPLHSLLGYPADRTILSMCLRSLSDNASLAPSGHTYTCARCVRGMKKVMEVSAWTSYALSCAPDIVYALSDALVPGTRSQKRVTKSLERGARWLNDLMYAAQCQPTVNQSTSPATGPIPILLPMAGSLVPAARHAFAEQILEPFDERDSLRFGAKMNKLDDGVSGYVFELNGMRENSAEVDSTLPVPPSEENALHFGDAPTTPASLMRASLGPLPVQKPRYVRGVAGPHEILRLVRDVGVDVVDAWFAQVAANWGIELDFSFPVDASITGKRDLGHNLYAKEYAEDMHALSTVPKSEIVPLVHAQVDIGTWTEEAIEPEGPKRAYLHHLLHTHEMGAHALLVLHNLEVVDQFMKGVRGAIANNSFGSALVDFETAYREDSIGVEGCEPSGVFAEAKRMWHEVDMARGRGRLARER
ncbi:tRNA-guanine transglycosylase, partial [Cylindrobasidium torrendii FP15055 ss-10]